MNGGADAPGRDYWVQLARRELRLASGRAAEAQAAQGMPGTAAEGGLIRPLAALAALRQVDAPPAGFWSGVLAIQLAHEASLIHDDVVDGAAERRGEPTALVIRGVAGALVRGDHLLTAAYRAAAATGSLEFATLFARAVERTVMGEAAQAGSAGKRVAVERNREIALSKAGELLGCALALAPVLEGRQEAPRLFALGRRVGLLYQMLDDLLDYCPGAATGKPALGDFAQRRWTWVLDEAEDVDFDCDPPEAAARLHDRSAGPSTMDRCLARLREEAAARQTELSALLPGEPLLGGVIAGWITSASAAVDREAAAQRVAGATAVLRDRVPGLAAVDGYLAAHSRSFRFATRFFPADSAARVARVYAYCRCTDDLVDRPSSNPDTETLLDAWVEISRRAYDGATTGLPLLDRVMTEMAQAGVPFEYAEELAEGMRMDLQGARYETQAGLRRYTYRVASVVGLWITRLFGMHDPAVLARAERMGHAMQLTNILRDVGEDWSRGRLYLPLEVMRRHGVTEADLEAMYAGAPLSPGYRSLVEELLEQAERDYSAAFEAVPALPRELRRPVAVAAHVYRGIDREIRRNGHDNLRRRAFTSPLAKAALAASALWGLARSPAWSAGAAGRVGSALARAGEE